MKNTISSTPDASTSPAIKFVILPEEQAQEHINRIQSVTGKLAVEVKLTDDISTQTRETHQRAQATLEGIKSLDQARAVEMLIGQTQGILLETMEPHFKNKGGAKKALDNAAMLHLRRKADANAVVKGGVAILTPKEGPVEIPKPKDLTPPPQPGPPKPEIPETIESLDELTELFRQFIVFYFQPGFGKETLMPMRNHLGQINTTDSTMDSLVAKLQTALISLYMKARTNKKWKNNAKKQLLRRFVTKIDNTITEIAKEKLKQRKLFPTKPMQNRPSRHSVWDPDEEEGVEEEELFDEKDLTHLKGYRDKEDGVEEEED